MSPIEVRLDGRAQAARMLAYCVDHGLFDDLFADPLAFVNSRDDLDIHFAGSESDEPGACSIAGHYTPATGDRRARITIATTSSTRRRQFTVTHELGHHLQQNVPELADAVAACRDDVAVEEAACDAFAAAVLLPEPFIDDVIGARGPTADDVCALYDSSNASREVCAIAASQRLLLGGCVVVLDEDGTVTFAAPSGDFAPPKRRSSMASSRVFSAAQSLRTGGGSASGDDRLTYSTGTLSNTLYFNVAWCGGYAIAVLTEGRAAWESISIPRNDRIYASAQYDDCEYCGKNFRVISTCRRCGHAVCPSRHCGCTTARRERACSSCHLVRPVSAFIDGSDECSDCR